MIDEKKKKKCFILKILLMCNVASPSTFVVGSSSTESKIIFPKRFDVDHFILKCWHLTTFRFCKNPILKSGF